MELKAGYKQTEMGVIPEDWKSEPLGKYFVFKNGLNKSKEFFGYGTPIVNYMDVYANAGIYASYLLGRVEVTRQELDSFGVKKGDVFFTRTSETVDEVGITSVLLDDSPNTVFSGFVLRARPKNDELDNNFKKYCFSSSLVRKQIISKSTYTTRALTNGRVLSDVFLPCPSTKTEQEAIAEALSDADALIGSLEQLIHKKRQIKQGAMQELLTGKKRLSGFSREWTIKQVSELGEVITGGTPRTNITSYWGEGYPWITPTDISAQRDMYLSERAITLDGLQTIRKLPDNTVLITCIASIGKNAILKVAGACNQQINALIPNKQSCAEYLYYLFELNKQLLISNAGITATLMISKNTFQDVRLKVPEFEEQTAIATIINDMDDELDALATKLTKARQIKQGMTQELLTGRIRLV